MATTYVTKKGDTWDSIAYSQYGDEELISSIMNANRQHIETAVFECGVILEIPDKDITDNSILPPWRK